MNQIIEPSQMQLFASAVAPADWRTEPDDRYAAAIMEGIPLAVMALASGMGNKLSFAEHCEAIISLAGDGFDFSEIAKLANIHPSRVTAALAFAHIPPALQDGIRQDKIKRGAAKQLLSLSVSELAELNAIYLASGHLGMKDISELHRAQSKEQSALLPDSLFPTETPGTAMEQAVRAMARHTDPQAIRDAFEEAMERVFESVE